MAEGVNFGLVDQDAFYKGAKNMNGFLQAMAQQQAGKQMAAGNTPQAVQTLQSSGNIAGAQTVNEDSWKNDDRIKGLDDAKRAEHASRVNGAATSLQRVKAAGGNVSAAFDQLLPEFVANGMKPEEVESIRGQLAKDPDTFLNALATKSADEMKMYSLSPGTRLANSKGDIVASAPFAPQTKVVTDGNGTQHLIQINSDGSDGPPVPGNPSVAPAPSLGAPITSTQFAANLQRAAPGAVISSGQRSAAENARVGGVPNSNHLTGNAADVVPAPGQSMAELNAAMQAQGYHTVPEHGNKQVPPAQADHIHVDFNGRHPGQSAAPVQAAPSFGPGVRELYTGTPKPFATGTPGYRSAAEVKALGYPDGTVVQTDSKGVDHVTYKPTAAGVGANGKPAKMPPQEEIELKGYRTQAQVMSDMVPDLDQFAALNKKVETGGALGIPGAAGIVGLANPDVRRMSQIASSLIPAMRKGMPGSVSDKDAARFSESTVGVDKPKSTNDATIAATKAIAKRIQDHAAFLDEYARQNGTIKGGQEMWMGYVGAHPLFADTLGNNQVIRVLPQKTWREAIGNKLTGGNAVDTTAGPKIRTYNPATGKLE